MRLIGPTSVLALAVVLSGLPAWGQAEKGAPVGVDRTASLASYVPAEGLAIYFEVDGLDGHAAAWRASAMYKALTETKLGDLAADLTTQGIDALRTGINNIGQAGHGPSGKEWVERVQFLLHRGVVLGMISTGPDQVFLVSAVRDGAAPEVHGTIETMAAAMAKPNGAARKTATKGTRTLTTYGEGPDAMVVWNEEKDTIVASNAMVERVIDTIAKKGPSAENLSIRTALARPRDGFEPVARAFVDLAHTPPVPPQGQALGLGGLKRVEFQVGFQQEAIMTVLKAVAPVPRKGVLALFDQPTFDVNSLPPLPTGLHDFSVISADFGQTYDRVVDLIKLSDPDDGARRVREAEQALNAALKMDARHDLLPNLGPKVALYAPAADTGPGQNPALAMFGLTITAPVKDQDAVARGVEGILALLSQHLAADAAKHGQAAGSEIRKADGPLPTWTMSLPPGRVPPGVEPTVIVGPSALALAFRQDAAKSAVRLAEGGAKGWVPDGAFREMGRRLPKDMVALNVNDPRGSLPALVQSLPMMVQRMNAAMAQQARGAGPNAPAPQFPIVVNPALVPGAEELARHLFPGSLAVVAEPDGVRIVTRDSLPSLGNPSTSAVLVGLLLPAVQSAREAGRRAQCMDNLRQIGLALHTYHASQGHFPRPAITDASGKPLLSWRVAILPYIEQQALYDQFHLDEPWDSEHNKALLASMPSTYICPSAVRNDPSTTGYRIFSGKGALFDPGRDISLADVLDGTSSTLAVVESSQAVPWTRPDELPADIALPASPAAASSSHPGGFNALMADGSVRFFKSLTEPEVLRALITRGGKEKVELP